MDLGLSPFWLTSASICTGGNSASRERHGTHGILRERTSRRRSPATGSPELGALVAAAMAAPAPLQAPVAAGLRLELQGHARAWATSLRPYARASQTCGSVASRATASTVVAALPCPRLSTTAATPATPKVRVAWPGPPSAAVM